MELLVQTRHAGGLTGARSVARVAIALSLVFAMGGALAQGSTFQPVPEFEAWIAEAEKGNKDPVDLVQEMRQAGKVSFAQSREFNRYVLARTDGELARAKAEGAKLDAELAQKNAELAAATKGIVAAMNSLDAQGRMGPKAVAELNWLFNNGS